jgi:hypothetical protein
VVVSATRPIESDTPVAEVTAAAMLDTIWLVAVVWASTAVEIERCNSSMRSITSLIRVIASNAPAVSVCIAVTFAVEMAEAQKKDCGAKKLTVILSDTRRRSCATARPRPQTALYSLINDGSYDELLARWKVKEGALRTGAINGGA